jgi:hypothetical protein
VRRLPNRDSRLHVYVRRMVSNFPTRRSRIGRETMDWVKLLPGERTNATNAASTPSQTVGSGRATWAASPAKARTGDRIRTTTPSDRESVPQATTVEALARIDKGAAARHESLVFRLGFLAISIARARTLAHTPSRQFWIGTSTLIMFKFSTEIARPFSQFWVGRTFSIGGAPWSKQEQASLRLT